MYALTARWRRNFIEFVANDVKSRNPNSVLDIGCGTGEILSMLTKHGIELYGIDPSPFMLELAEKRIRDSNAGKFSTVNLRLGDSGHISFDRKFDIIFSSLSFHHWTDRERNIPTILERLNENGEFVIYEYYREAMPYLRRLIAGRHALSEEEANELRVDGYTEKIEKAGSVIIVRFKQHIQEH
jgi:ubiquinone/menaquinone biosynthesis C-methylase UbiE